MGKTIRLNNALCTKKHNSSRLLLKPKTVEEAKRTHNMYTLSLAVKSMCCKKADYMHTNLSSLYTTGCSIATSACKAKKAFASLV